jgi:phage baseplate assembly protein W
MVHLDYPYGFDGVGRTAAAEHADHIRDLIEQVLFTAPGERVNRPDFGSGLLGLVFEPGGNALAAATRASVEGALQRWLGDLIQVEAARVRSLDSTLEVSVQYVERLTQVRRIEQFRRAEAP